MLISFFIFCFCFSLISHLLRCTDGIIFVVDSVDVERMEEAKMELMRTAKSMDNHGVPILIFANKQDLPGAKESKELEKLLGLHELSFAMGTMPPQMIKSSSTVPVSTNVSSDTSQQIYTTSLGRYNNNTNTSSSASSSADSNASNINTTSVLSSTTAPTTLPSSMNNVTTSVSNSISTNKTISTISSSGSSSCSNTMTTTPHQNSFKGWYIQPACAITGDGLQEGLEALYDMIIKKRKLNKAHKKKR